MVTTGGNLVFVPTFASSKLIDGALWGFDTTFAREGPSVANYYRLCAIRARAQTSGDKGLVPVTFNVANDGKGYIRNLMMGQITEKHKEKVAKLVEEAMPKLAEKIKKL